MLWNLTPAAERAMEAACRLSGQQGSQTVLTAHLLAGVLEEAEGRAAVLLTQAGVDPDAIDSHRKSEAVPTHSGEPVTALHPLTEQVLDQARGLAALTSPDRTIGSEHLLLGLLQVDTAIREQLEAQGLDFARIQSAVIGSAEASVPLEQPLSLIDATEEIDLARIIDAGIDRAREALRVIEDYCRFVLDDPFLSRQWKEIRHDLAETLGDIPDRLLLEARDTVRDVGTAISTPGEHERTSLQAVIFANCKRLQESLRSLEEYGKLRSPDVGRSLERLRYRSYTLERAMGIGAGARQRLADARLYVLLTWEDCRAALDWTIRESAAGGAQIIQLREKSLKDRELLAKARQVRRWTREAGVLFILNDRPDIARLAEADGVHVGQDDLPVKEARRIVGPQGLVGVSTHNLDQVRQAVLDGASYIGVGPTFSSRTKEFDRLAGLDFARTAAAETSLPAFVIGGVNLDNVHLIVEAGLTRIAVSHAISQAPDPRTAAGAFRRMLDKKNG
jgi:thiamine-phosphate pyrophosphorylase